MLEKLEAYNKIRNKLVHHKKLSFCYNLDKKLLGKIENLGNDILDEIIVLTYKELLKNIREL